MFWPIILGVLLATESTLSVSVQCSTKKYVVILFQPVTLTCDYQTTSTKSKIVTWKYKSYCRDPISAALNPSSAANVIAQNNPNYNPNIECADNQRTVRIVASKDNAVTLGKDYQGRKISIVNDASLNFAQTGWGDSGVYVCSVVASDDLSGNGEDYTELIVLERKSNTTDLLPGIDLLIMEDWLLVVLVVVGFFLLLALIGICWCQCCPHTCCCYVRCPCCPDKCCCPRALYEAGKAAKKITSGQYAGAIYAPPIYGGSQPSQSGIPLIPIHTGGAHPQNYNGYGHDYDAASSVGQGSQVPLLRDENRGDPTRSGYRIQVDPSGNATRAIYYMEQELAALDPSRPANYNRLDNMSEVSSLHDNLDPRGRGGRSQPPALPPLYDHDEAMSTISSVSQQGRRRDDYAHRDDRTRARSMDNLDDIGRGYRRDDFPPHRRPDEPRGRRGSDDEWSSSARSGYDRVYDDRRRRDYSPESSRGRDGGASSSLAGRRTRSRDDLMDLERNRRYDDGGRRDDYDDSFLREAMERKKMGEQQRARSRERLDSESERSDRGRAPRGPPPLPVAAPSAYPAYSDDESASSAKKSNLRKNGAVSRESLVV